MSCSISSAKFKMSLSLASANVSTTSGTKSKQLRGTHEEPQRTYQKMLSAASRLKSVPQKSSLRFEELWFPWLTFGLLFGGGERELKLARKSGSSSGSQFQWNSGYGLVLFVDGFSRSRPETAETQSLRNPRSHHTCKNTRIRTLTWFHPWTHVLPACFTSQLLDDAIDMKMWLA